ncbi:Uncharacterised protein [Klebsiella pneumoniae]|nr:Uncharacterised protein [Klebsiella pneumoniae]
MILLGALLIPVSMISRMSWLRLGSSLIFAASCMPVMPGMSWSSRTTSKYSRRCALVRNWASASLPDDTALTFRPQPLHCCTSTLRQVSLSSTTSSRAPCSGPSRSAVGFSSCCGSSGRVSDRVVPWLLPDWMPNSPPISRTSWRAMIRPRWLPSLLAERKSPLCSSAVSSASRSLASNGWPLSCTAMRRRGVSPWSSRATTSRISPSSVCLNALSSRLRTTWRRRVGSPPMTRGTCGWVKLISSMRCCSALTRKISRQSSINALRSNCTSSSSICPDSSLEMSSISLISVSSSLPALWMVCT